MKKQAEQEVQGVQKVLEETLYNIMKLKKEYLVEIKSLGSPPLPVKVTVAGLVILCEKVKTYQNQINISKFILYFIFLPSKFCF
jgi:dynein heavy chain, axonemal